MKRFTVYSLLIIGIIASTCEIHGQLIDNTPNHTHAADDIFNEAGVEIMSPHYVATRDGNASTIPSDPFTE